MDEIDKGHKFQLKAIDGDNHQTLQFVKRIGDNYPYNQGVPKSGTTNQEILRVLIKRTQYLETQKSHWINSICIFLYRLAIYLLELRASNRKNKNLSILTLWEIENRDVCPKCGHINCDHLSVTVKDTN